MGNNVINRTSRIVAQQFEHVNLRIHLMYIMHRKIKRKLRFKKGTEL